MSEYNTVASSSRQVDDCTIDIDAPPPSTRLDEELQSLSDEAMRALLDECVDHSRPDSSKSQLVQDLKRQQKLSASQNKTNSPSGYGSNGSEKGSAASTSKATTARDTFSMSNDGSMTSGGETTGSIEMHDMGQRPTYMRFSANGARESTSPTDSGTASCGAGGDASEVDASVSFPLISPSAGPKLQNSPLEKLTAMANSYEYTDRLGRNPSSMQNEIQYGKESSSASTATAASNSGSNRENKMKKRLQKEMTANVLAENIPGHMGDKDVEYLAEYITGEPANNNQKNGGTKGANSIVSLNSTKSATNAVKKRATAEKNGAGESTPTAPSTGTMSTTTVPNTNHNNNTNNTISANAARDRKRNNTTNTNTNTTDRSSSPRSLGSTSRASPREEEARDTFASNHHITHGGQAASPPTSPRLAPSASSYAGENTRDDITDDDEKGYQSDQGHMPWKEARRKRRQLGDKQAHADRQTRRSLPSKAAARSQQQASSNSGQPAAAKAPASTTTTAATTATPVASSAAILTTTTGATTVKTTATAKVGSSVAAAAAVAVALPPVMFNDDETKQPNSTPPTANITFGFFDDEAVITTKEEWPALASAAPQPPSKPEAETKAEVKSSKPRANPCPDRAYMEPDQYRKMIHFLKSTLQECMMSPNVTRYVSPSDRK